MDMTSPSGLGQPDVMHSLHNTGSSASPEPPPTPRDVPHAHSSPLTDSVRRRPPLFGDHPSAWLSAFALSREQLADQVLLALGLLYGRKQADEPIVVQSIDFTVRAVNGIREIALQISCGCGGRC